jgi:hypothetical protein
MSKEVALERIRKMFDAKTSEIRKEYEKEIKELEVKIERKKKERDASLIKAEEQFRKDPLCGSRGL